MLRQAEIATPAVLRKGRKYALIVILIVAAYIPGHIKQKTKHPMLAGVKLWALAHLIAHPLHHLRQITPAGPAAHRRTPSRSGPIAHAPAGPDVTAPAALAKNDKQKHKKGKHGKHDAEISQGFARFDANRDGLISRSEFPADPLLFDRLDANRDGVLSLSEA